MSLSARKEKPCAECGETFYPSKSTQKVCSFNCAVDHGKEQVKVKQIKQVKTETRQLKRELNKSDRRYQLKLLQADFNAYIRARDHDRPCISCDRHHTGQYHAGHYRTVGACPALRFDERNCHKQCAPCNNHLSGNLVDYRINLIKKLGSEVVEWIEGPHAPKKYTLEEIAELRSLYKQKLKDLKNAL